MTDATTPALELCPVVDSDFEAVFAITMVTMRAYAEADLGVRDDAEHRARIRDSFDPEAHRLVRADGQLAGVLAVEQRTDHVQLVKVFLLPQYQGRGIGTWLVRRVMAQAAEQGLPVRLRVLRVNPAQRLYIRLGFVVSDETPERLYMQWQPGSDPRGA